MLTHDQHMSATVEDPRRIMTAANLQGNVDDDSMTEDDAIP
jgi:hypothetical protein